MSRSHITLSRTALALLLLTTGLSAQRYTGHDHAVFHRQPQAPSPAAKHQSSTAGNPTTSHQKTTAMASAPPQLTSRPGAAQGKLDNDLDHNSAPAKTEAPLENPPRL
jgi:hypothetical protein